MSFGFGNVEVIGNFGKWGSHGVLKGVRPIVLESVENERESSVDGNYRQVLQGICL